VRRAVGSQEELGIATGGRVDQSLAMFFPFEHRQAVHVRVDPAGKDGVAIVQQMMSRDCGRHIGPGRFDESSAIGGGQVLEHNLQVRMAVQQGFQLALDEYRFTVKDIHLGVGHLAMHQQGQSGLSHGRQYGVHPFKVGYSLVGVGGCTGGIQLAGVDGAAVLGTVDFID